MSTTKRIIVNTTVNYTHTILSATLTLFSSRWVLQALGVSDFGLYYLVGSIIVFITFFNSIMATSASRHFAFELGRNIEGETNKWFNTALSIHSLMPIILILMGYPIGIYLINNVLNITPDRISVSIIVFKVSLFSAFFGMLSVPYIAMFTAKQKFIELAIIRILQSMLIFIAAYSLRFTPGDNLINYSILMVGISVFIFSMQILRGNFAFKECRIHFSYWRNRNRLKELITFAFWNLIGNFGHLIRSQGLAFLTNLYFGTNGNAAFGISNQLSNQTSTLTNALSTSVTPEIIKSEGLGDTKRAIKLSFQSAKLGIFLILLLSTPLLIETNYILNLWLTTVPEKTKILCQLMIVVFMIEKTTFGYIPLLQAINKISKPQISLGITFSLSILVAYLMIKMKIGIESIGWAVVSTMALTRLILAYWVKIYLNVSFSLWIKKIIIPYILIILISLLIAYTLKLTINPGILRLVAIFCANFIVIATLCWKFLLDFDDRSFLKKKLKKIEN